MTTVKEAGLATIDLKLEVIVIPVSDAERGAVLSQTRVEAGRHGLSRGNLSRTGDMGASRIAT